MAEGFLLGKLFKGELEFMVHRTGHAHGPASFHRTKYDDTRLCVMDSMNLAVWRVR